MSYCVCVTFSRLPSIRARRRAARYQRENFLSLSRREFLFWRGKRRRPPSRQFSPSVAVLLLLPTRHIVDDCAADQNSGVHSHLANAYGRHRKPKCPLVHAAVPRIANNAALIVCDASQKENFSPGVRHPIIFALVVLLFVNDISRDAFEKRISKKKKTASF